MAMTQKVKLQKDEPGLFGDILTSLFGHNLPSEIERETRNHHHPTCLHALHGASSSSFNLSLEKFVVRG